MKNACLVAVLLAPGLLWASPEGSVRPERCEEGRPIQVRVTVKGLNDEALALDRCAVVVGSQAKDSGWTVQLNAMSLSHLSPDIVTLGLTASEDLGNSAVARAPMPDVRASLDGQPYALRRLVSPGESLSLSVSVVPAAETRQAVLAWRARKVTPKTGAYRRSEGHTWSPGGAEGPLGHGAPSLGGGTDRVAFRVDLTRWSPWKGKKKSREVLIPKKAYDGLEVVQGEVEVPLVVVPAAFGLKAAAVRAKVSGATDAAVRLKDDRWILQQKDRWWVVPAEGEVAEGRGVMFPFALDLARSGRGGFMWYGYHDLPKLAQALRAKGFGKGQGKGLPVEVKADGLVPFLRLLEAHGARLGPSGIEKD